VRLSAAAIALLLPAVAAAPASAGRLERAGLVDVTAKAPTIELDLRYATERNFTGAVLPGYCKPLAYARPAPARALARVQRALRRGGLGLLVLDAYRPARATRAMVRWAQRTHRTWLLNGYIARRSNHNRGAAVDLTLVRDGHPVTMGTRFDSFSSRARTLNATGATLHNRLRLKRAMEREGFRNYSREWWHYDYPPLVNAPLLDVPLGC
jgi:D-alanyl-D-alanine dipeptidase